jgi:hypothetical protein
LPSGNTAHSFRPLFLAEAGVIALSQILSIDFPANYSGICFTPGKIRELQKQLSSEYIVKLITDVGLLYHQDSFAKLRASAFSRFIQNLVFFDYRHCSFEVSVRTPFDS